MNFSTTESIKQGTVPRLNGENLCDPSVSPGNSRHGDGMNDADKAAGESKKRGDQTRNRPLFDIKKLKRHDNMSVALAALITEKK